MPNELLFLAESIIVLSLVVFAHYLGRSYLIGLLAVSAVLMNIFVVKGVVLFGLATAGGSVLYAGMFLINDILNEHYGKKVANQAIWIGFFVSLFFLITSQFALMYLPASYDIGQPAFAIIFTLTPRIVAASMAAYLVAQFLDVWLFARIKEKTGGRFLWVRNNISTAIAQLLDAIVFNLIAFLGVYPNLLEFIIFAYIFKIFLALLDTPFVYLTKIIKPRMV